MKAEIEKAIKSKTLFPKIICFLLGKINLSNRMLQALQVRYKNYSYLKKKYGKYIENIDYPEDCKKENSRNIWICWLQGEENAPELVKVCIGSVRKYMSDYNIHIITFENMEDYIRFPQYILEKWHNRIISNTLMSDLIRTELLVQYGGLWLDATVLLTAPVPEYVFEKKLFMYTHSYPDDVTMVFNNWLIYSDGNSRLLRVTRDLLYEYWKHENVVREYFMWHLFMTMATEKYPGDAVQINYVTDELPETLARVIFRPYEKKFWKSLTSMTSVHKLSNKFCVPDDIRQSYFEKVISKEL